MGLDAFPMYSADTGRPCLSFIIGLGGIYGVAEHPRVGRWALVSVLSWLLGKGLKETKGFERIVVVVVVVGEKI